MLSVPTSFPSTELSGRCSWPFHCAQIICTETETRPQNKQANLPRPGPLNAGRETQLAQKESSALWSQLVADQHRCCVHLVGKLPSHKDGYWHQLWETGDREMSLDTLLRDQDLIPWLSMWLRLSYHACKASIATNTVYPVLQLQACLSKQLSVLRSDCWITGTFGPGTGVRH